MKPPFPFALLRWLVIGAALLLAGVTLWYWLQPEGLDDAFARGNGRIEATEIDVATKLAGRVAEILVNEGDFVEPDQVVARMDTRSLEAERRQAEAELQRSRNALQTARAGVAQNESHQAAAEATVHQREAELDAARKRFERSSALLQRHVISYQQVDDDRATMQSARAALSASQAEVAAARASVAAARSQVIEAQSAIDAAQANVERVQSEIEDSLLRSDRLARVQYRVSEPGEVLAAGGKVLNLIDLTDVYMTFFLPTSQAGRVALGDDALEVALRYRYNPDVRSLPAMVPAMIPLLLMMIPAMLTALGIVREKELGSITNFYVTPVTRLEFLLGKQLPYVIMGMLNFFLLVLLSVFVFGVPLKGSLPMLSVAALLYVFCATGFGLLVSALFNSQIAAVFGTAIGTVVPAIQFSGLLYPVSALEGASAVIGHLYPTSHFLIITRGIFSKALGAAELWPSFLALLVTSPLLLLASVAGLKKQEK